MGTASAQAGGVVTVIKLMTKPFGSLASCDFALSGRIGSSSETAVVKLGSLTREETYLSMSSASLGATEAIWLATDEGSCASAELGSWRKLVMASSAV